MMKLVSGKEDVRKMIMKYYGCNRLVACCPGTAIFNFIEDAREFIKESDKEIKTRIRSNASDNLSNNTKTSIFVIGYQADFKGDIQIDHIIDTRDLFDMVVRMLISESSQFSIVEVLLSYIKCVKVDKKINQNKSAEKLTRFDGVILKEFLKTGKKNYKRKNDQNLIISAYLSFYA
jgi:hypothetical protein